MLIECVIILGVFVLLCSLLCAAVIIVMWKSRRSRKLKSFYYRCCWNESCINLFTLTFFLTTMYVRYFSITFPTFYYLNRFKWWTKFAQVTQEHVLYMQILNVFLTVGGRFCTICLPLSRITQTAEQINKWKIFTLQTFLPTVTVIPLYCIYDHGYGIRGITMPLWLSAVDPTFDEVIYITALVYRSIAFVLSFLAYVSMFYVVRKKANRNEMRILFHGGSLLLALLAALICTIVEGLEIGQEYALMRLFYFTTILWVPCIDIVTTFWIVASLRDVVNPFKRATETIFINLTKHSNAIITAF